MKLTTKSALYTIRDVVTQIIDDPGTLETYSGNFERIEDALRYMAVEEQDDERYTFLRLQMEKYRMLKQICLFVEDTEEWAYD